MRPDLQKVGGAGGKAPDGAAAEALDVPPGAEAGAPRRPGEGRPGGMPGGPAPAHTTREPLPSPLPRLAFHGVTRMFGRHEVLHGIDLRLDPGQRLVLAGPNGAGKTTLLRLAAGLLRPTMGAVTSGGRAPTDPRGRRAMGHLSQDAPVYAELTVREHLSWWTRMQGQPLGRPHVDDWLDRAGLRRLAEQRASALSRGQRQRLAIAMVLAPQPDLLLLDEPTTALDAAGRAWLVAELQASNAAMLIASHEPWPALGATEVRMEAGRIVVAPSGRTAGGQHRPRAGPIGVGGGVA